MNSYNSKTNNPIEEEIGKDWNRQFSKEYIYEYPNNIYKNI